MEKNSLPNKPEGPHTENKPWLWAQVDPFRSFLVFIGNIVLMAMRVNINVAIIDMVKPLQQEDFGDNLSFSMENPLES